MNHGIWAALGLGFLGSLHCVGMCGPLVLALPQPKSDTKIWAKLVSGRLLYNLGRVATYALLGSAIGILGSAVRFSGFQQIVSIIAGVLILLWLVIPKKSALQMQWITKLPAKFRGWLSPFLKLNFFTAQFGLGILNGLLPCGLVYVAIAGAILQPTIFESALFMSLFGVGTFPALLFFGLLTGKIKNKLRFSIQRFFPVSLAIIALLLILRGLAFNIPFLSPQIPHTSVTAAATTTTCH